MIITIEVSSRDRIASSYLDGDITVEEDGVYLLWLRVVLYCDLRKSS